MSKTSEKFKAEVIRTNSVDKVNLSNKFSKESLKKATPSVKILEGKPGPRGLKGKTVRGPRGPQGKIGVGKQGIPGVGKQGLPGKKGSKGDTPGLQAIADLVIEMIKVPTAIEIASKVKPSRPVTVFGKAPKISKEDIIKILKDNLSFEDIMNLEDFPEQFIARGAGFLTDIADVDSTDLAAGFVLKRKADGSGFEFAAESGGSSINFADDETPTGTVDGVNAVFTLANTPSPAASLKFYVNGQLMKGGGEDYTLVTATVTMVTAPPTTSILIADYRH